LTESGRQFADLALIPVVHYNAETAEINGLNMPATEALNDGLATAQS